MNQIRCAASGLVIFVNVVFGSDIDDVSIVASSTDEGINTITADQRVAIVSAVEGIHADFSEKGVGAAAAIEDVGSLASQYRVVSSETIDGVVERGAEVDWCVGADYVISSSQA